MEPLDTVEPHALGVAEADHVRGQVALRILPRPQGPDCDALQLQGGDLFPQFFRHRRFQLDPRSFAAQQLLDVSGRHVQQRPEGFSHSLHICNVGRIRLDRIHHRVPGQHVAVAVADHAPRRPGHRHRPLALLPGPLLIEAVVHDLDLHQLGHNHEDEANQQRAH